MKILIVLTSNDRFGDTDQPTGFWLEELATPYYVFKDAGAELTLASPSGGRPPMDPASDQPDARTDATERFKQDDTAQAALSNTHKLSTIDIKDFDAVFYPGGHGPVWDLTEDEQSIALIENAYATGKPVAAVCHGPAVFRHTQSDGQPLVSGKRVTGFTNSEEKAAGHVDDVPFLVETMLKKNGGEFHGADDWQENVIVDGNLVTGQNPASSRGVAQAVIDKIGTS
ncbi:MAG: type 1 glutamine amidotransferase domain-containing protein [Gammaproteobacteria bacterium]|nr:type 1 glutamine amidotransferase domain-containing protein [Gammaproteobacteria bacterium]